jgi:hypothetical protein
LSADVHPIIDAAATCADWSSRAVLFVVETTRCCEDIGGSPL